MKAGRETIAAGLAEICGAKQVLEDPARLAAYAIGGAAPEAAVLPGSAEEVAEIVKFACAQKSAVVPCGARTKLGIGMPPSRYDIALDLTRLNRVVAYDPDDLTLGVEAGVSLQSLMEEMARQQQLLPLAVPFSARATAGGTIAAGVDSLARQAYGTARDWILGMEFVTGEGVLARSGGRVVKNVTGYDLHKLMIGSLGTLGVITKINFRTFPRPANARTMVARFSAPEGALALREALAGSALQPVSLEILSPGVAELFYSEAATRVSNMPLAGNLLTKDTWALMTGFAGSTAVLERCEQEFRVMAERSGARTVYALGSEQTFGRSQLSWVLLDAAFWRRAEFAAIALEFSPGAAIIKAGVVPSRMKEVIESCERAAEAESLRCATMARGCGVIYMALLPESANDAERERVRRAAGKIQAACYAAGGHASIPWCPSAWKKDLKVLGNERADWGQMRKVKAVFDPAGILSPGRFAGGI